MDDRGWVLAHDELAAAGLTVRAASRLVRSGGAFRPLPRVVSTRPPSPDVFAEAGLARAGVSGSLWGAAAAQSYLGLPLTLPVEVIHRGQRTIPSTEEVRFRRSPDPPPPTRYRGRPLVPPAIAVVGVAQSHLDENERRALATGLLRRRLVTADQVEAEAWRVPTVHRARFPRWLEELHAGAWSCPEAVAWRGQVERRMPVPRLNVPFRTSRGIRYVDGWIDELCAGYEIHGRADHERTWDEDLARAADLLVEKGAVLLPIPAAAVLFELPQALDRLGGFWRNRAAELGVPVPTFVLPPWCRRR